MAGIRYDDIGQRLKAFRLGSDYSADEIGERIGISRAALYRYEKGDPPKLETLDKIADLLDVSLPSILGVGVEYVGRTFSGRVHGRNRTDGLSAARPARRIHVFEKPHPRPRGLHRRSLPHRLLDAR